MRAFRVATIRIEIGATFSIWLVAAGLAAAGLTCARLPRSSWEVLVVAGAAGALAFTASLVAHELGHALAALGRGIPVRRIRLCGAGGVCERASELRTPADECLVAAAGPAVSATLALLIWAATVAAIAPGSAARCVALLTAFANALLAVPNLIPIYPLDGGKLVHALLWRLSGDARRARDESLGLGRAAAGAIVVAGVWLCTLGADFAVGSIMSATGAYLLLVPTV